ncbi:MAG: hypothetical protein F4X92_03800, partial [Gammaproteobacteria bacterium]|nr:hypothetical protein [Gammaproteobacteria bacterium]
FPEIPEQAANGFGDRLHLPPAVGSLDELRERILLGIKEMNAAPVPFRWKSFDRLMSENTEMNQ